MNQTQIAFFGVVHCSCLAGTPRVFSGEADQGVCVPLEPSGVATCATGRPVSGLPAAEGRV